MLEERLSVAVNNLLANSTGPLACRRTAPRPLQGGTNLNGYRLGTVKVLQRGRGRDCLLDVVNSRLMLRTPDKLTCFLGEHPEISCYGCQVRNKTTQELDHPKESL